MSAPPPPGGFAQDAVAVAYADDPARMYLYRPGLLVVGTRSEGLVTEQLESFGAEVVEVLKEFDAVLFRVNSDVEIPAAVEELLAEEDRLEVAPNHVFWQAAETVGSPTRIRVPGFGLVGRLLDAPGPEQLPAIEPWSSSVAVSFIDGAVGSHPLITRLTGTRPWSTPPPDPYQPTPDTHGTAVLGTILLRAPVHSVEIFEVVGGDGLFDEITLARSLVGRRHDLVCVPVGGFTHGDREPALLGRAVERKPTLVVAAAGNHSSERPFWPAAFGSVVAVGAIDDDRRVARWSAQGDWVDRYEEGVGVLTAGPEERWVRASGASLAAGALTGRILRVMGEQTVDAGRTLEILASEPNVAIQRHSRPSAPIVRGGPATKTSKLPPTEAQTRDTPDQAQEREEQTVQGPVRQRRRGRLCDRRPRPIGWPTGRRPDTPRTRCTTSRWSAARATR